MTEHRDADGKRLSDYPRPSVAVDTAVLTVPVGGELAVVQVRDRTDGDWRLPGTFVHQGERLADAVLRSLREKAGVTGLAPRQLHVFDDPARDDRGWVLSVAHLDVVPALSLQLGEDARLLPVREARGMVHGHDEILAFAVDRLRADHRETPDHRGVPDPHGLLPSPFTMSALRGLHEAVLGERLLPDSFRRAMVPHLTATDAKAADGPGKPATLYRR